MNLGIVDTKKIIKAVNDSFDLDLKDYNLTLLRRRFSYLLSYFSQMNIDSFIHDINDKNVSKDEFINEFLIDETEFFRDASFWRDMRETYLPEIAKAINPKIWMPCVLSGEEVYTLSIVLHEMGLQDRIKIIASCPSEYRIANIKSGGDFKTKKIEVSSSNYVSFAGNKTFENYYKKEGLKIRMRTDLLNNVEFKLQNISQDDEMLTYDMIVFRNILLQYTLPLYEKVIKKLTSCLPIKGYLIIGSKETLDHTETNKKMKLVSKTEKIYQKRYD